MNRIISLTATLLAASTLAAAADNPGLIAHHGKVYETPKAGLATQGFMQLDNATTVPEILTGASCAIADTTRIVGRNGNPLQTLPIAAGATATLTAAGPHLLLQSVHFSIDPGGAIPCTLTLQNAGEILVYLYAIPAP